MSFVVPSYNYGRFLRDCIDSILNQEGGYELEVIVVDDASTDDSRTIIGSYSDPRVHAFFHEVNQGHVVTINEGFAHARGAYIARIDSDDRYRPHFLLRAIPVLEKNAEVGLVYGNISFLNERNEITAQATDDVHQGKDFRGNEFIGLLKRNFVCAATVIARREAWEKALPIPQGLGFSDWYLNLQIARRYDFYYLNDILADYRIHPQNYHREIILNKTEEETVLKLLDRIFSEKETRPELEILKRKAKRDIYAEQYLALADKYFGFKMDWDARRCYLQAIRFQPHYVFKNGLLRHLFGTLVGRWIYENFKSVIKSAIHLSR